MNKTIKLYDYQDNIKKITIKNIEKIDYFIFEILSGDGVLTAVYKDKNKKKTYDSNNHRYIDFIDGTWIIEPKDIQIINKMKHHYDTNILKDYF